MFTTTDITTENIPSCIICFEELIYTSGNILWQCPQCQITIHKNCIEGLHKSECPHCRKNINNNCQATILYTNQGTPNLNTVQNIESDHIRINAFLLIFKFIIIASVTILYFIGSLCCLFFGIPLIFSWKKHTNYSI